MYRWRMDGPAVTDAAGVVNCVLSAEKPRERLHGQ